MMMYTGSNILPIADFLQYTHTKQSFRPDDVSRSLMINWCNHVQMLVCGHVTVL